jgi:hypothetical protein
MRPGPCFAQSQVWLPTSAYQSIAHPKPLKLDGLTTINMLRAEGGDFSFSPLVDGDAEVTTCHDATYLHEYKLLTWDKFFNDAGKKTHRSVGEGSLRVAVYIKGQTTPSHFMDHSYHTPTIPSTVLSPGHNVLHHSSWFDAHTVYTADVEVPSIVWGVLLYAQASRPVITAYATRTSSSLNVSNDTVGVNHITAMAERVIWHQRLGHVNPRKLADMHKSVKGIL